MESNIKTVHFQKSIHRILSEAGQKKAYLFAANHSFDEDIISVLANVDRNAYMLHGTTDQMRYNPVFMALWLNGMIYVRNIVSLLCLGAKFNGVSHISTA